MDQARTFARFCEGYGGPRPIGYSRIRPLDQVVETEEPGEGEKPWDGRISLREEVRSCRWWAVERRTLDLETGPGAEA